MNRQSTAKTKILLIHPFFYPQIGGSQKYAEDLSVALMDNFPQFEVHILCYNTKKAKPRENYRGLKICRVPCLQILPNKFVLPNPFILILKLYHLRKENYDFVWTHIRFFDPAWWVWFYAKIIGAKSIFTGHCAGHPFHKNYFIKSAAKLVDLTIAKFSLKFYDQIQVTSQAAGRFFASEFGIKNYSLIHGGVDLSRYPAAIKTSPKESLKIVFIGRMIEEKGVSLLYQAVKKVLKVHPKVEFVLAGPGQLQKKLRQKIVQDNLEKQVTIAGSLNSAQVQSLLSQADIFAYPSLYIEGFPQSILEASAAGCFVIATNSGGTQEIIKHQVTGLLIPQKNANALAQTISWAIRHPTERKQMACRGRKLVTAKFNWQKIARVFHHALNVNP